MRSAVRRVALAFATVLVIPVMAGAQTPTAKGSVALALEVSGGRIAGVEAFKEIAADTKVEVPAGARLVFQHYGSCRKFTVTGGTVTFRADGVDVAGGKATDVKSSCPRRLTLKDDGASAAVVLRSAVRPRLTASPRPDFVVVGPRASEFNALRVRRGTELVLEQSLAAGPQVRWPTDAPALAPNTSYDLELVPARADGVPIVIGFRTLDTAAADESLTLVNAE
ncbi:MAG TPA: hypothetical protein VEA38_17430 [Terriglobales bacterium]|nr:hypothetical protein [Terriglobales bacterium]